MATTVSKLQIMLSANSSQLSTGMKGATKTVKTFSMSIKDLAGTAIKGALIGAVAGAVASFQSMVRAQFDVIDGMAKLSRRTGIAVADLQRLTLAGKLAGVGFGEIETALRNVQKRISEATGPKALQQATRAFSMAGLDPSALRGADSFQQFQQVINAIQGIGNQADRARVAMDLFGRSGQRLLSLTEEDLKRAMATIDPLTKAQTNAVEAFNDSLTIMGEHFAAVSRDIASFTAAALEPLIAGLNELLPLLREAAKYVPRGAVPAVGKGGRARAELAARRQRRTQFVSDVERNNRLNEQFQFNRTAGRLVTGGIFSEGGLLGPLAAGNARRGLSAAGRTASGFLGGVAGRAGGFLNAATQAGQFRLFGGAASGAASAGAKGVLGALSAAGGGALRGAGAFGGQVLQNMLMSQAETQQRLADSLASLPKAVGALDIRTAAGRAAASADPHARERRRAEAEAKRLRERAVKVAEESRNHLAALATKLAVATGAID